MRIFSIVLAFSFWLSHLAIATENTCLRSIVGAALQAGESLDLLEQNFFYHARRYAGVDVTYTISQHRVSGTPPKHEFLLKMVDGSTRHIEFPVFLLSDIDALWKSELSLRGFGQNMEQILNGIPPTGRGDFDRLGKLDPEWDAIDHNIGKVVRERKELREINVVFVGLGDYVLESKRFIEIILREIRSTGILALNWKVRVFCIDKFREVIDRGQEFLAEDFPAQDFPFLKINFAVADINNAGQLKIAISEMGASNLEMQYIVQRHVSHANTTLSADASNILDPIQDAGYLREGHSEEVERQVSRILKVYLPYRNLFSLLGRPGTQMILGTSADFLFGNSRAIDFVPPGTIRSAPKGSGIIQLVDPSLVARTGIADFQQGIREAN